MPARLALMSREMVSTRGVRDIALALPGTTEADHWGNPSFRVRGKIFATVPDPNRLNVMIDPFDVDAVVRENPEVCSSLWWGKEVRGVQVTLAKAQRKLVAVLLESAWRRKAPRRVSVSSLSSRGARPPRKPKKVRPKE
jgi:hypothetical protein